MYVKLTLPAFAWFLVVAVQVALVVLYFTAAWSLVTVLLPATAVGGLVLIMATAVFINKVVTFK